MAEKYSQEEINEAYFTQLVFTFQATAMQQMGKIVNPLTDKVEKDMVQAKHSIDIVSMLEQKTKGNLNEREKKLVERVLFELRMNYVDEMKVVEEEEKEEKEAEQKVKPQTKETDARPKTSKSNQKTKPRKKKKSQS